mmetsp:Transcript_59762/g.151649  ORF Transcript_59762/g.151649 Transcript_59762/m.151649 type:complete len:216 (+) Transcript_59762:416-1063(+)
MRLLLPARVRRALHLHKVAIRKANQLGEAAQIFVVHAHGLHHRQPADRPLSGTLRLQRREGPTEPLPVVFEERPANFLKLLGIGRVDRNVQLRDPRQLLQLLGKLTVRDQEGRDPSAVQGAQVLSDLGVEDRLSNQRQRHMLHGPRFLHLRRRDQRGLGGLFDELQVLPHRLLDEKLRIVGLKHPGGGHGIGVVPPAEGALVRACQRRSPFHAPM